MTLQELINAVMLKATGKPTVLAQTNTKWEKIRGIANYYQKAWAHEPGQHWNSLYNVANIGTVSNESEYDLPDNVEEVSTANGDDIFILTTEGKSVPFKLIEHDSWQNHPAGNYCFIRGRQIIFPSRFSSDDPCLGGTLYAPAYYKVPELVVADDETVVDMPEWLVTMTAAEYIRNDIVKQNQYGNLVAEANNLMTSMIKANRGGRIRHIRGSFRNGGGLNYD